MSKVMTEQEFLEWATNAFMISRATEDGFNNYDNALDWLRLIQKDIDELKVKTDSELEDMAQQIVDLCDKWMRETEEYIKAHPDQFPDKQRA